MRLTFRSAVDLHDDHVALVTGQAGVVQKVEDIDMP